MGFCEHCNEPLDSIKLGEFLDQIFGEDLTPLCLLVS